MTFDHVNQQYLNIYCIFDDFMRWQTYWVCSIYPIYFVMILFSKSRNLRKVSYVFQKGYTFILVICFYYFPFWTLFLGGYSAATKSPTFGLIMKFFSTRFGISFCSLQLDIFHFLYNAKSLVKPSVPDFTRQVLLIK